MIIYIIYLYSIYKSYVDKTTQLLSIECRRNYVPFRRHISQYILVSRYLQST